MHEKACDEANLTGEASPNVQIYDVQKHTVKVISQKFDQLEANLLLSNFTIKDLVGGNHWKRGNSNQSTMNMEA